MKASPSLLKAIAKLAELERQIRIAKARSAKAIDELNAAYADEAKLEKAIKAEWQRVRRLL